MKPQFFLFATILLAASCHKQNPNILPEDLQRQVVFSEEVAPMRTKATPVTELQSFYASAVTLGENNQEEEIWTSVPFSRTGDVFSGNKWWPLTNPDYYFYASNIPLRHADHTTYLDVTNTATDVVCAYRTHGSFRDVTQLNFKHVLARLGQVNVSAASGYTVSDIDIRITPYVSGTLDILANNDTMLDRGWSNRTPGSATVIASSTPGTKENDIYLLPGNYRVTASWTATQGDYSETYLGQTTMVSLRKGIITRLSIELGGDAAGIQLSTNVQAWGALNLPASFFQPLCFEVISDGTITWTASDESITRTLSYSKDAGRTWNSLTSTTAGASINVQAGDIIVWVGEEGTYSSASAWNSFGGTASFYVYGDISSLIKEENSFYMGEYAFSHLFAGHTGVRLHPMKTLDLSTMETKRGCYAYMFQNCTGITSGASIKLPAERVMAYAFQRMFSGCSNLITGPDIVSTRLDSQSCREMFYDCTSLTSMRCTTIDFDTITTHYQWFMNVPSTGTFYLNSHHESVQTNRWARGDSGIPETWTKVFE